MCVYVHTACSLCVRRSASRRREGCVAEPACLCSYPPSRPCLAGCLRRAPASGLPSGPSYLFTRGFETLLFASVFPGRFCDVLLAPARCCASPCPCNCNGTPCCRNCTGRSPGDCVWLPGKVRALKWATLICFLARHLQVLFMYLALCSYVSLYSIGDPALAGGVGLDDPQRALPTPNILWFCDMIKTIHFSSLFVASITSFRSLLALKSGLISTTQALLQEMHQLWNWKKKAFSEEWLSELRSSGDIKYSMCFLLAKFRNLCFIFSVNESGFTFQLLP